jgi:hypothetical protein
MKLSIEAEDHLLSNNLDAVFLFQILARDRIEIPFAEYHSLFGGYDGKYAIRKRLVNLGLCTSHGWPTDLAEDNESIINAYADKWAQRFSYSDFMNYAKSKGWTLTS